MSIERVRSHYGFSRMPFSKDLAPGMLHLHRSHQEAVARISWCVAEQAIGVVTGECGSGKTVAARAALSALDASRHTVVYLGTPGVGTRGTYSAIVSALGATPHFHLASLIPRAQDMLLAEATERGKSVVVTCDEAHLVSPETLEGLRCLANAGMDQSSPFCLLLLGRRRLKMGPSVALDQRVSLRYAMAGMDAAECASYVRHHLSIAGRSDTIFSDDALGIVHQVSRGLPRLVNNLAVQCLVAAYAVKKSVVDESAARAAVAEVSAE